MKKKILLVEDDKILRDNTAEILQLANYEVITAENGKLGIEKAHVFKPDIIICDILMPELDGYGVLQIAVRDSALQKVPFIFMSAKTNHDDVRKGMDMGACDYITKPFDESELLSAVSSRLKRNEFFEKHKTIDDSEFNKTIKFENLQEEFSSKEKFLFNKGASIYCEGNNSNHIFYIISGTVKTFKNNEIGKELITGIFKKQNFFGFTSFLKNKAYDENAVALKKTIVQKVTKPEILKLVKQNPQMAINFMDLLSENLNKIKDQLIHLAYDSVRKKTADALLQLNHDNQKGYVIKISRSDLANIIGIAKETLIRTLTDFKEENLIKTDRNSIEIVNFKKIKSIDKC
ncbi:MAG: response regulator [Flavobacteriaceae bacterium]|nr:response regulator [Flavobacteriaceae bacterium]